MSGHGMVARDMRSHGPNPSGTRRRSAVAAVAALSLVTFGAVAQAAGDDGPDRDDPRAAAVATTEPSTESTDELSTESTDEPSTESTDEPSTDSTTPETGSVGDTPPGDPPDGLGTDADLDALAQDCYDGDLVACDHLFLQSPVDSPYEEYGDTCAGRQEAGTENYCGLVSGEDVPVVPDEPVEPTPPGDFGGDPALDALANDCYAGDMDACDQLYDESEPASDYQIYGDTCAGRQPENTGNFCRDLENPVQGTGPISSTSDVPTTLEVEPTITAPVGQIPPPTEQPTGLGADPALDTLALSCFEGDMASCDELYNSSDPDTDYRRYGDTCAGRQPEGTNTWCRTAFGDGTQSTNVTVPPPVTVPLSTGTTQTTSPVPTPPVTVPPFTVPPPTIPQLTVPQGTAPLLTLPPTIPQPTGPTVPSLPTIPTTSMPGVIPPPTLQPTGLGNNAAFDTLALACFDGDMKSCDDLFRQADAVTDPAYSEFADTCAGRQPLETGRWCEAAFPATGVTTVPGGSVPPGTGTVATGIPVATQQPTGLGNDPALNTLAEDCFDGDMQSCDDLFLQSELGSPYHEYGDTCAGRQRPGTYTYCTVAFPATTSP